MYQGRNFDHVSGQLIGSGSGSSGGSGGGDRARDEGLLFLGRRASLRQSLETLERIVDEYPVLVRYLAVLRHRRGRCQRDKTKGD